MKKREFTGNYISPRIKVEEVILEGGITAGSNEIRPGNEQGIILIEDWTPEENVDGIEGGSRW